MKIQSSKNKHEASPRELSSSAARHSKTKGRRFQSWVRDEFKRIFQLGDDEIRCAIGSENGSDIKINNARCNYSVECKNTERLNIWSAWKQTTKNHDGKVPLLIVKRNHHQPLVIMNFEEFERLQKGAKVISW